MEKSIIKLITIFLIGFIAGSFSMFFFLSPKIAQMKAEQIKIEAFSECVQNKIIGAGEYQELYLLNVLECLELINNN